jgi:hypothetical protein
VTQGEGRRVVVGAVTPAATAEEVAAIVAAIELTWPEPVAPAPAQDGSAWRFSGRSWRRPTGWPHRSY